MNQRSFFSFGTAGIVAVAVAFLTMLSACTAVDWISSAGGQDTRADLTAQDGLIPEGQTLSPFDTEHPAVTRLDPALLTAIRQAASDAEASGVEMVVNSGWRSEKYQQVLLDEAVQTYGSRAEALKWVSSPQESEHVTGDAVDIGPTDADSWLSQHGNAYGLCQTYANEIWHFELAVEPGGRCPAQLSDAAEA